MKYPELTGDCRLLVGIIVLISPVLLWIAVNQPFTWWDGSLHWIIQPFGNAHEEISWFEGILLGFTVNGLVVANAASRFLWTLAGSLLTLAVAMFAGKRVLARSRTMSLPPALAFLGILMLSLASLGGAIVMQNTSLEELAGHKALTTFAALAVISFAGLLGYCMHRSWRAPHEKTVSSMV